ncbi:MAG: hypothetical protein PF440_06955 [Thiomicrorhabdus sp.]|jgi:hypothetical protein|nr:hypothetical protein [Thiomicrorhabdus sp.]
MTTKNERIRALELTQESILDSIAGLLAANVTNKRHVDFLMNRVGYAIPEEEQVSLTNSQLSHALGHQLEHALGYFTQSENRTIIHWNIVNDVDSTTLPDTERNVVTNTGECWYDSRGDEWNMIIDGDYVNKTNEVTRWCEWSDITGGAL